MAQPSNEELKAHPTTEELLEFADQEAAKATERRGNKDDKAHDSSTSKRDRSPEPSRGGHHHDPEHAHKRYSEEREYYDERRRSRRSREYSEDLSHDSDTGRANRRSSRRHGLASPRRVDFSNVDSYRPSSSDRVREPERDRRRRSRSPRRRSRSPRRRDDRDRDDRRRDRSPMRRRTSTPPPAAEDRDSRTVFVQQLANSVDQRRMEKFFSAAGKVKEAQVVRDRVSHRSKGVGYVEFFDAESAKKAVAMTGKQLKGVPVIVQMAEAEKNRQTRGTGASGTLGNGVPFHRLYVGNVHFNVTDGMLKEIFEAFGEIENFVIQKDDTGRSRGYGFVQYKSYPSAKQALQDLNGFDIAGRAIRVGLGNDKSAPETTENLLKRFDEQAQAHEIAQRQPQAQGSSFSGLGGRGQHGGTGGGNREKDKHAANASALDDADINGEGMNYAKYDRHDLMSKLSRTNPEEKSVPKPQRKPAAPAAPEPTRCLLIKYAYKESEVETKAGRDEIIDDFQTEAEENYGHVLHVTVGGDLTQGEVYMKFETVQGAINGYRGMTGRHFAGNMLTADYISETIYNLNFRDAPK